MTCSGLRILKSNESMSVEKMPTLRSPTYFTSSGGCRSAGKRKNGAHRLVAERDAHRRDALLDFGLGLVRRHLRQVLVRPGVRADGVAGRRHLLQDFGMPAGMLADREEQRLGALVGQRLEHGRRVARPRAVVEGQHDFFVAQEVIGLEVLEAEAGAAGGVDLHHAGDAERVRIVAFCRRRPGQGPGHSAPRRWRPPPTPISQELEPKRYASRSPYP